MSLRTLIVDDEPLARERIASLLENEPDVTIIGECGDGKSAARAIKRKSPDIVFLDIQLPEMDGFAVLESLGSVHLPAIIFVTAYDQFALKAFRVHALDYLLKPIDGARLSETLHRVRETAPYRDESLRRRMVEFLRDLDGQRSISNRVVVKIEGEMLCLKPAEIDWIESAGNYVCFHVGPHTHISRETMNEAEQRLRPHNFLRVHRSTIVNFDRIKSLKPLSFGDYELELRDGTRLPMSRSYRDGVLSRLEKT